MEVVKWPKDEKGVPYIIDATSLVGIVEQNQSGEQNVITLLLNLNLMVQTISNQLEVHLRKECSHDNTA